MVADLVPCAGHAFGAQTVDLSSGDAGLDVGGDVVQHFRSQTTSYAHAFDLFGRFDGDAHTPDYSTGGNGLVGKRLLLTLLAGCWGCVQALCLFPLLISLSV